MHFCCERSTVQNKVKAHDIPQSLPLFLPPLNATSRTKIHASCVVAIQLKKLVRRDNFHTLAFHSLTHRSYGLLQAIDRCGV